MSRRCAQQRRHGTRLRSRATAECFQHSPRLHQNFLNSLSRPAGVRSGRGSARGVGRDSGHGHRTLSSSVSNTRRVSSTLPWSSSTLPEDTLVSRRRAQGRKPRAWHGTRLQSRPDNTTVECVQPSPSLPQHSPSVLNTSSTHCRVPQACASEEAARVARDATPVTGIVEDGAVWLRAGGTYECVRGARVMVRAPPPIHVDRSSRTAI